jgi:nucleoside-diphosphate-sugar epimerase
VVRTAPEIVSMMRSVAPSGQPCLDQATLDRLGELTRALRAAMPGAPAEYARFLAIASRSLPLPAAALDAWLGGKTVLVTGGTGCIGRQLLGLLAARGPRRLVSVSRGVTGHWPRRPGAEYLQADIRNRCRLNEVFGAVRPDLVFHLAAQREPGLAEHEVHRTVTTNVLGTKNVLEAAAEFEAAQVICASTGKALRPYSPDVYAASKRVAEWLTSRAATSSRTVYSAARFTHVVDNSIVHGRLLDWCQGGTIRLHGADIAFYAESALESAELLLAAGLGGQPGELRVHVITDLGWPVSLLGLALGALEHTGSATAIYFSGYDRGYESAPFPGLYDPRTAGEVSPLLSAFEAAVAKPMGCVQADAFPLAIAAQPELDEQLRALSRACAATEAPDVLRAGLDDLSWSLLDATLTEVAQPVLARAAQLAARHQATLTAEHQRLLAALNGAIAGPPRVGVIDQLRDIPLHLP